VTGVVLRHFHSYHILSFAVFGAIFVLLPFLSVAISLQKIWPGISWNPGQFQPPKPKLIVYFFSKMAVVQICILFTYESESYEIDTMFEILKKSRKNWQNTTVKHTSLR
jgi:TRAP-type mannitol/chloroaromatic compound transport system permease small subunit